VQFEVSAHHAMSDVVASRTLYNTYRQMVGDPTTTAELIKYVRSTYGN
jgi:hypothetical protein